MPVRVIVTGIILLIMVSMLVFTVEYFLPLSVKSDMNILCRNTLLDMETSGGLIEQDKLRLQTELLGIGLVNVIVTGAGSARYGESLNLRVEADYAYNRLSSLLSRINAVQHMRYDKTSISRRVVN